VIFCLSVCGLLILGHCHYNTFHRSTLYTYYFVGSILFECWMYTTTHYENNAASFSCFIFHHFRVTLDTNLLHTYAHTHICSAFCCCCCCYCYGTQWYCTLAPLLTTDEYYKFRICRRKSNTLVILIPTIVSQYETTSTVFF